MKKQESLYFIIAKKNDKIVKINYCEFENLPYAICQTALEQFNIKDILRYLEAKEILELGSEGLIFDENQCDEMPIYVLNLPHKNIRNFIYQNDLYDLLSVGYSWLYKDLLDLGHGCSLEIFSQDEMTKIED